MKIDKNKAIKVVGGVVVPILGAAVSLAANWFDDKKLDDKVAEKVAEALANKVSEE